MGQHSGPFVRFLVFEAVAAAFVAVIAVIIGVVIFIILYGATDWLAVQIL